jgi:predicted transcriptional regulator
VSLSEKINARIPPELKKALEDKARELDRSESYVINRALEAYLKPTKP